MCENDQQLKGLWSTQGEPDGPQRNDPGRYRNRTQDVIRPGRARRAAAPVS
jgi:hypothetical protein